MYRIKEKQWGGRGLETLCNGSLLVKCQSSRLKAALFVDAHCCAHELGLYLIDNRETVEGCHVENTIPFCISKAHLYNSV